MSDGTSLLLMLGGLCLTLAAATWAGGSEAFEEDGRCEVVAHRGFSSVAPENTLAAVRKAIEVCAEGSECDVRASADGAIVLMHDDTVDRTTGGRGKVADLMLGELKRLDAGVKCAPCYAGEPIPTIEEYLAVLKGSPCKPVIEIKAEGITEKVADAVRDAGMVERAAVISFSKGIVKQMRTLEPRLLCGLLLGSSEERQKMSPGELADWIDAQARDCSASFVDLDFRMLSAETVSELRRRRVVVWTWTVNTPEDMERLLAWGINSVTTDRPDVLRGLLKAKAILPGRTNPSTNAS
jgi:glycerophosphoryl diester phosphodiesterase